jgi:ankyrin repeat protein
VCSLLLENGAVVNALDYGGRTALHKAARRGHTTVAKMLLDKGANVDKSGNHF